MYKITIFFLILSGTIFAQKFDKLIFKDTIVLIVDNNISESLKLKVNKNNINQTYLLYFEDKRILKFLTHKKGIFAKENIKICQQKLKNSKFKIFTLEQFIEAGFDTVTHTLASNKIVIYIVDVKTKKKRKILLKKAHIHYLPNIEI